VYEACSPGFRGRCTAPLLVDGVAKRIVCNESADLVRMLNEVRGLPGDNGVDLYPAALRGEIDITNDLTYRTINNGVYCCGFATTQAAYDAAAAELGASMAALDARLASRRFLCGERFTEADLRLFPTIARFDAVYAGIFKCGARRVADLPHLGAWMRDVHQLRVPGGGLQVADALDVDAARRSYYTNLFPLNPGLIVPSGPTAADLRLDAPPGRGSQRFEDVFHFQ